jgi:hypothetical protein
MNTFLLRDILSNEFKSINSLNELPCKGMVFEFNARYDLMTSDSWNLAKKIAASFPNEEAKNSIPICHVTYKNGSEQDLYSHFAVFGESILLIEVSHSYIDNHFIDFKLRETDDSMIPQYPMNVLFSEEFYKEEKDNRKVAEIFIKPTAITIHIIKYDVSKFLPTDQEIKLFEQYINNYPVYHFWTKFLGKDYLGAYLDLEKFLKKVYEKSSSDDEYLISFYNSLYGVCKYLTEEYEAAARLFIVTGKDYLRGGLKRNADVCFFFALEAGKRINDINKSFEIASELVECFRFLDENLKDEVLEIIKSYYGSIYIGVAVLCRRVIEIYISEKLEKKFGLSIKEQIIISKKNMEMPKNVGPGLFAVLELAKLRGIINDQEHILGSNIKDFGNGVHDKGTSKNKIDAKYALQACIHLIHRG